MHEKNINSNIERVNKLISQKKFAEAIPVLEKLDSLIINNYFIKMNLASCFSETGDYNRALEIYSSVSNLPEKDSNLYFKIGDLYFKKQEYDKSIELFDEAIKYDSNHTNSFINKGISLFMLKKHQESNDVLFNVYEKTSNDFLVNSTIAANLMFLGKFKETLPYINKCVLKDKNNLGIRKIISIVYSHLGDQNEAEKNNIYADGMIVFHDDAESFELIKSQEIKI